MASPDFKGTHAQWIQTSINPASTDTKVRLFHIQIQPSAGDVKSVTQICDLNRSILNLKLPNKESFYLFYRDPMVVIFFAPRDGPDSPAGASCEDGA